MKARLKKYLRYLIPTLVVLIIVSLFERISYHEKDTFTGKSVRCVIAIDGYKSSRISLSTGFNYEMLKRFASDNSFDIDICLAYRNASYIDSLGADSVQIVVMPYHDSLIYNRECFCSTALADSTAWLVAGDKSDLIKEINSWIAHYTTTDDYASMQERFTPSYEPYRRLTSGRRYKNISPYDAIIRRHAARLGWDSELLTALIWQESRFHIEAKSHRGAVGLMQLMPHTARRFEVDNLLDPEENISSAVDYLYRIRNMFRDKVAEDDLAIFTLAGYNAGEGRILDCIRLAQTKEGSTGRVTWAEILNVIPEMNEDEILDNENVRLGKFKGTETIKYVEHVMSLYYVFSSINMK